MSSELGGESITVDIIHNHGISHYAHCFELHFNGRENRQKYRCRIADCSVTLSDQPACNRHLKNKHNDIYRAIAQRKAEKYSAVKSSESQPKDIRVTISVDDILNGCVEMVTASGMPYSILESAGLRSQHQSAKHRKIDTCAQVSNG